MIRPTYQTPICLWILILSAASSDAADLPFKAIEGLGSEKFSQREEAENQLLEWGRKQPAIAMDELQKHSRISPDPEVRARCLDVLRSLVEDQYLREGEGYVGVALRDETVAVPGEPKPRNVIRIVSVMAGSPGSVAGLKPDDIIIGTGWKDWKDIQNETKLREELRKKPAFSRVTFTVLRAGKSIDIEITLGRRPPWADNAFPPQNEAERKALEKATKEAYFKQWLEARKAAG